MNATISPTPTTPEASTHEPTGYNLGWDHARHAVDLPARCLAESSALRAGWLAGRAAFGSRCRLASRAVQMWLHLRRSAWMQGVLVEPVQVTPHYLTQLEVGYCPVTRVAFSEGSTINGEAVFSRLRSDAGYAAGHLALLSAKADHAIGAVGWRAAMNVAQRLDVGHPGGMSGLTAPQWARLAVLRSFVEPIPHAQACELPLLVLPPNRLRLFNPAQALQAFVCRQLLVGGWSLRISRVEALVPGQAARQALQTFFHALLPRVLEAGRNLTPHQLRWAIEDAWHHPLVRQRWSRFAGQLSATQCEALVLRAHARRLGLGTAHDWDDDRASEGWMHESGRAPARPEATRHRAARGAEPCRRASFLGAIAAPPAQAVLALH